MFDVSVIIPTFNRIDDLPTALDSVFKQPNVRVECIVVDDGSTDGTVPFIQERYREHALRVIQKPQRSGPQASRNLGMAAAQGEFVTFLDSDDYFEPNTLAARVSHCREAALDALFSGYAVRFIGRRWDMEKRVGLAQRPCPRTFADALLDFKIAPMITIMYRRSRHAGLQLDQSLASGHDDDLALYLIRSCRFDFDDVPAATIVQHVGERVATPRNLMIGDAQLLRKYADDLLRLHGPAYLARRRTLAAAGLLSVRQLKHLPLVQPVSLLRAALHVPTLLLQRVRRHAMMAAVRRML